MDSVSGAYQTKNQVVVSMLGGKYHGAWEKNDKCLIKLKDCPWHKMCHRNNVTATLNETGEPATERVSFCFLFC